MIHYLTPEEETAIKASVPWSKIEPGIRELIALANSVTGIATLQSCEGHVCPKDNEIFEIESAHVAFRTTHELAQKILFDLVPSLKIRDVSLRYFGDGTFWINVGVDPAEIELLFDLFKWLKWTTE